MKNKSIITVIDIGSTKVCCCIAHIAENGQFQLIGIGHCGCTGVRTGLIIDIDSVKKSIALAVEDAEKMANVQVQSVYVSVSGQNIRSQFVDLSLNIGGRVICEDDIAYIAEQCTKNVEQNEVIHVIPVTYSLDSLSNIRNPIGMVSQKLSAVVNIVTIPSEQLQNIIMCLSHCHLELLDVISSAYAAGLWAVDDTDANHIVLDLGGGTTNIAFFYQGVFCGAGVLSLGGKHITKDIAYGLGISYESAERLKTLYGSAVVSIADESDMMVVPVIEEDGVITFQNVPKAVLNRIVHARVSEIFERIKDYIDKSKFHSDFATDIILTGGWSHLTGIQDYAANLLKKRVIIKNTTKNPSNLSMPITNSFAVCLGMIKFIQSAENAQIGSERKKNQKKKNNILQKALHWLNNNL